MNNRIYLLLLILLLAPLPARAYYGEGYAGPTYPTFDGFCINDSGSVNITDNGIQPAVIRAVAVQPWDGMIIIGGLFTVTGNVTDPATKIITQYTRNNLARLNSDGTVDPTFNPEPDEEVRAIVVEPLSKTIYIGGKFNNIGSQVRYGLARLDSLNGNVDGFTAATRSGAVINAISLGPDSDSILVGGTFSDISGVYNNIARVSVSSLPGAMADSYLGGTNGEINAILVQDGNLIIGGNFALPRSHLARFFSTGSLDPSFPEPQAAVRSLALQTDGKLVVGGDFAALTTGWSPAVSQARNYLARLNRNGTLDDLDPGPNGSVAAIAVQPDGKILIAGAFTSISRPDRQIPSGPFIGPPMVRNHVARLNIDGTLDKTRTELMDYKADGIDPNTDGAVNAIALEPNGRFLIAGEFTTAAGKARTRLARFYFHGALDDDGITLGPSYESTELNSWGLAGMAQQPNGMVTVHGLFGTDHQVLRLNSDFSVDNFFSRLVRSKWMIEGQTITLAIQPDGALIVGGYGSNSGTDTQHLLQRLDERGVQDASFRDNISALSGLIVDSAVWTVALLPRGSVMSKETCHESGSPCWPAGTALEDGMMYVGGDFRRAGGPNFNLIRLKKDGTRDLTFKPAAIPAGRVYTIAIQRDDKILVGGKTGQMFDPGYLVRLETNGDLDATFPQMTMDYAVKTLALQRDDGIIVGGAFDNILTPQPLARRSFLRLDKDGTVDPLFYSWPYSDNGTEIKDLALLSDKSVLISGLFQYISVSDILDENIDIWRDDLALFDTDANLMDFYPFYLDPLNILGAYESIQSVVLQPDGKMLVGGDFPGFYEEPWRLNTNKLARFAHGWATQELTVSEIGGSATITWRRTGTGPELWGVIFEESADPESTSWRLLGRGEPVAEGWALPGQSLARGQNRYVRARGYSVGTIHNPSSSLIESVRLYYLEPVPVLRVTARAKSKTYGEADPLLDYEVTGFLPGDTKELFLTGNLARTGGENAGLHPITVGDLKAVDKYAIDFTGATLTINKAPLVVTPDNQSKSYGAADPEFTFTASGFVNGDDESVFTGSLTQTGEGAGVHAITQGDLSAGGNYTIDFHGALLTITGQAATPQSISFSSIADRTYGDSDFNPGGTSTSGLTVSYASSNPAVAVIVGGQIHITGAGNTVITASQAGNGSYAPAADVSLPFTVKPKALTVRAEDKARAYRAANPALTASYVGFVLGEGLAAISGSPDLSTAAWLESPVGNYGIEARVGTLSAPNYTFTLVNGTLSVLKSCQEIVFPPINERTYGDPPFEIIASACSGLDIGFTSSNPQVARIDGKMVTITGAGGAVITASQGGSGELDQAPDVSRTVTVHKSGQAVSFSPLAQRVLGDPPFTLAATASSGLPVNYLSANPEVAVISGTMVTIVGAGTTVITAIQAGDGNYNAALAASQPLTVSLEVIPPLLSLSTLSSGAVTADPVLNISGTASDASGIASLTVNGADLTGRAALFSSSVALVSGQNSISVTAKDGAGNMTTQTLSVILDAAAPAIGLSEPADNSVTNLSFFTARGTVTPGSAVTMGVNGRAPQSLSVADGVFTGSGNLEPGVNTIELSATLSGRVSRIKRSVTLSTGKSFVAVTEPAGDIRTELESVMIRGIAGGQGSHFSVVLDVDGRLFTPAVQAGAFQQLVQLNHAGQIRITASVTDAAGNLSVAQRNIIKVDRIMGDLNGDSCVDIRDAAALLRISLGMAPATVGALAHGDVAPLANGIPKPDGKIDISDLLVLLRKIVGLVDY